MDELPTALCIVSWVALAGALSPLVSAAIVTLPGGAVLSSAPAGLNGRRLQVAVSLVLMATFGWLVWQRGLTWATLVLSVYAVLFVIIAAIDVRHRLILNRVIIPAAVFALLVSPTLPDIGLQRALWGALAGFAFFLVAALLVPGGLGGGDVKLAGFLGLATGFPAVLTALITGVILGGVATGLLLVMRRIGRRDYIPYGPFLLAGAVLALMKW